MACFSPATNSVYPCDCSRRYQAHPLFGSTYSETGYSHQPVGDNLRAVDQPDRTAAAGCFSQTGVAVIYAVGEAVVRSCRNNLIRIPLDHRDQ